MEINVLIDKGLKSCPEDSWLRNIVEQVLTAEGAGSNVELGLFLVTEKRIRQLNQHYLGEDRPTDVLAFQPVEKVGSPCFVMPSDGIRHLGEVIVSYPQATAQAEEHQHSVNKEIAVLIIHGVLHLLGYDHDETETAQQMRTRETEILSHVEEELK